ncbi:unnamed protein product [Cylindrotheca closterium]|uniref:Ubiquitin carboxyl-terminal hydrolase n=1 Tax=Cylindrotheca closterium TaxID=2856 RepID=A0AAD2FIL6_9STRA|nr:unnamed protein product [Cylindrotheca closterium]
MTSNIVATMKQERTKDRAALFPLEANPDTLNHFLSLIGFDVQKYQFVDVLSTSDEDLLNLVPRPAVGVLLVKPSNAPSSDGTDSKPGGDTSVTHENIWHISQTIGGACGSVAVLHLIASLQKCLVSGHICKSNSWLEQFLSSTTRDLDEEFHRLHNEAACHQTNQTSHAKLIPGKRVGTTFVALVPVSVGDDGNQGSMRIVELDGRKSGPVIHGNTSSCTFLRDSCRWIEQNVMKYQPDGKFAILALAANKSAEE